jgi:AraC-like DNA-binding protein
VPPLSLHRSAIVAVEQIDHQPRPAGDAGDAVADRYSVNFVDRGRFALAAGGGRWRVGPEHVFVTVPGMEYRCHEVERDEAAPPGRCLDVCFSEAARDGIEGRTVDDLRRHVPVLAATNRHAYLRRRLAAHLAAPATESLAIDLLAGELLHSALAVAPRGAKRFRPTQLAWYAARIDRVRDAIDEGFRSPQSLAALARTAGMSPFHFARVFRELTGVPPHRYVLARRLEAAARRLRDGAPVTETCYASGFGSLSHFIHVFRRAYGVSPSRLRHTAAAAAALPRLPVRQ